MKKLIIAAAVFAAAAAAPAMAQINVNVSLGDPNFYGRVNALDFGPPQVVYQQPVIIERGRYAGQPVYLRVPPGHMKHWSKHCARYNACGQQVYFVRDAWYSNAYAARNRERAHGDGRRDYQDRHEERHEDKHEDKHGHGNGNGHGHGKHGD